jgi:hypothetical protein
MQTRPYFLLIVSSVKVYLQSLFDYAPQDEKFH